MATFEQAGRMMRVYAERVGENTTKVVKDTALAVDETVVTTTPVDTGQARLNWQVEIGAPASGVLAEPESPDQGAARALEQGRAKINQYQGGSEINITNNLPYIERLNNGYSAQAPVGYVEAALAAGAEVVKKAQLLKR